MHKQLASKRIVSFLMAVLLVIGQPSSAVWASDADTTPLGNSLGYSLGYSEPEPEPEEPHEFTPEELGLKKWNDPNRNTPMLRVRSMLPMAAMASTVTTIGNLPYGTVINIPYNQNGAEWALPCVVMVKDHAPYGKGVVLRTKTSPIKIKAYNGGNYRSGTGHYENSDACKWMNSVFYSNVGSDVRVTIKRLTLPNHGYYRYKSGDDRKTKSEYYSVSQYVWFPSTVEVGGWASDSEGVPWKNVPQSSFEIGLEKPNTAIPLRNRNGYAYGDNFSSKNSSGRRSLIYLNNTTGYKFEVREGVMDYDFYDVVSEIIPFFMVSNGLKVKQNPDGTFDFSNNSPPNAPSSISYSNPAAGESMTVTCSTATDPDGDALTYLWEQSINGGAYTQFASTTAPRASLTVPSSTNIRIRVRTKDPSNEYSGYTTGAQLTIIYPPNKPSGLNYPAPQVGETVTLNTGRATHPNGLSIVYCWERSTDSGNTWTPIGESANPTIADTAPTTGLFYRIRVRAKDTNNRYSDWSMGDNHQLNHPPTAPKDTKSQIDYQAGKIHIHWSASTDANGDTLTYTVQGKTNLETEYVTVSTSTDTKCSIDIPTSGTDYLYRIFTTDGKGGISTYLHDTVSGIDRIAPTGKIAVSTKDWTADGVTLTLTASDTGGAGVRRVRLQGGEWVNGDTLTYTAAENGTHTFEIEDWNGNVGTVSYDVTNIDKQAPEITSIYFTQTTDAPILRTFAAIAAIFNKQALIHIEASDDLSGVERVEYQLVEDGAEVDPKGWLPYDNEQAPKIDREFKGSVAARAIDQADNVSDTVSENVIVDNTPPETSHTVSTTDWINGDVEIVFTATDSLSGVASITLPDGTVIESDTATFTATINGDYKFIATDRAGKSTEHIVTIDNIDKEPLTGIVTPSTTDWTNQDVTLSFTASASLSGVKRVRVAGGEWVDGDTVALTVTKNGTCTFEAENHAGTLTTFPHEVGNIDTVKPVVESIAFSELEQTVFTRLFSWIFNKQALIHIEVSDELSGVERVEYQLVEDGAEADPQGWKLYKKDKTKIDKEFKGTVIARAIDHASNISDTVSENVIVDNTPPVLTYTVNTKDWTNQDVLVTVYATDLLSGVASITLPDGTVINGDTATYTATQNGDYTFIATDFAGNSKAYFVTISNIDKDPPKLPELPINDTWVSKSKPIEVNKEQIFAPSGVDKVQYSVTPMEQVPFFQPKAAIVRFRAPIPTLSIASLFAGFPKQPKMKNVEETQWYEYNKDVPITIEDEGTFLVLIRAISKAGNVSPVDQYTVRNDLTPPSITHTVSGDTIRILATDKLSGVASITLPDGTVVDGSTADFKVPKSGTYEFIATDNAGNASLYTVTVTLRHRTSGSWVQDTDPIRAVILPDAIPQLVVEDEPILRPLPPQEKQSSEDSEKEPEAVDTESIPATKIQDSVQFKNTDEEETNGGRKIPTDMVVLLVFSFLLLLLFIILILWFKKKGNKKKQSKKTAGAH